MFVVGADVMNETRTLRLVAHSTIGSNPPECTGLIHDTPSLFGIHGGAIPSLTRPCDRMRIGWPSGKEEARCASMEGNSDSYEYASTKNETKMEGITYLFLCLWEKNA